MRFEDFVSSALGGAASIASGPASRGAAAAATVVATSGAAGGGVSELAGRGGGAFVAAAAAIGDGAFVVADPGIGGGVFVGGTDDGRFSTTTGVRSRIAAHTTTAPVIAEMRNTRNMAGVTRRSTPAARRSVEIEVSGWTWLPVGVGVGSGRIVGARSTGIGRGAGGTGGSGSDAVAECPKPAARRGILRRVASKVTVLASVRLCRNSAITWRPIGIGHARRIAVSSRWNSRAEP